MYSKHNSYVITHSDENNFYGEQILFSAEYISFSYKPDLLMYR